MAQVARDTGLSRESLYKALSGGRSPDFDTILKVVNALGLRMREMTDLTQQQRKALKAMTKVELDSRRTT